MADDRTEDPTLLNKLEGVTIIAKSSSEVIGPSKVKEPMGLKAPQKEMSGSSQLEGVTIIAKSSSEVIGPSKVKGPMGLKTLVHPQKEMSGLSQVKERTEVNLRGQAPREIKFVNEWTEVNLRGQAPIEIKFPSELNDALSDTQRLHVFYYFGWLEYNRHGNTFRYLKPERNAEVSVITYEKEYHRPISWNIDDDGAWIVFKDVLPLHLIEMISALAPLCQKVEHITIGSHDDPFFLRHRSQPLIPMRSVLSICLHSRFSPLHDSLQTVSRCFPNAKSLVLVRERALSFEVTPRHDSGISLTSLRRLELRFVRNLDTLDNLFLLLSSSCQNIESLTVTSDITLRWEKSSTAITECKLPNLTDIHLKLCFHVEHYALQMITNLLRECRVMSPSLKYFNVGSVQLEDVVIRSVEWSRTSSDCVLQIQGVSLLQEELAFEWPPRYALRKSAAVPITELIDITTSEFKEVTVLTLVGCNIDFGQPESKSLQSPKELGTLREIRFVNSENPLPESDRNKLSELYPNAKVTEKQESQESSEESEEGAGIPFKLDKASFQSLKISAIVPDEGDLETTKKECCKRVGADGGKLQLESFGIELEIPPGAIDSKEPQGISLRVLTDTTILGDTNEEMSVCFGVQCLAPGDLVLRSPVTYTIPHCAVATRYSGLKPVLYSGEGEYSPHAVFKERKVLSRFGIPSCNIMKDVLELKMDHFSWAKIKIGIKSFFFRGKKMCCWPFKQKNLPLAKKPVILHAHLYDDVKGNKKVVREDEEELGFTPAHIEQNVFIQNAEVDLEMGCYVKNKKIGEIAVVSFDRLTSGTRICEPFELDFSNQPDNVAVSLRAGQTKKLEVKCLFPLDFPIPQKVEKASQLDTEQLEGATVQTPWQQKDKFPELPERVVIDRDISRLARLLPHEKYSELCQQMGFEYNYTQNILVRHSQDSRTAFEEVLHEWKDKGGFMVDLDRALMDSDLGGLICKYKK